MGLELGTATIDTQYFFLLYNLLVHAASGGHKERSTYPSQCRDKDEKFFAQKTLKVPAACTGTCLPPATSSSLQPHNTASSQRPSGRWGIPVMEESTAQMNATGATRKNRLTQKLFLFSCFYFPLKTTLAKFITFEYWKDRGQHCVLYRADRQHCSLKKKNKSAFSFNMHWIKIWKAAQKDEKNHKWKVVSISTAISEPFHFPKYSFLQLRISLFKSK